MNNRALQSLSKYNATDMPEVLWILTHRLSQVVIFCTCRSSKCRTEVWDGCLKLSRPWLVLAQTLTRSAIHYKWPVDWRTRWSPCWMCVCAGGSFEPTFELRTLKTQPHDEEQVTSSYKSRYFSALWNCELPVCDRRCVCWEQRGQNCFSGLKTQFLVQFTEPDSR